MDAQANGARNRVFTEIISDDEAEDAEKDEPDRIVYDDEDFNQLLEPCALRFSARASALITPLTPLISHTRSNPYFCHAALSGLTLTSSNLRKG